MTPDRNVTIDLDLDVVAAVEDILAEPHTCETLTAWDRDAECGRPATVARLRRMTCGHEEHLMWRYACADHAQGRRPHACWHCRAPVDILAVVPLGGGS